MVRTLLPNIEVQIKFNYILEALNLYYNIRTVQHKGVDYMVMTS